MKTVGSLLAILMCCGCVYDEPLVEEAVVSIDPALVGLWQKIPDEGKAEDLDSRLVILPFSKTEYIAVLSPGDQALYFRAYPIRFEDMELLQLEWLGAGSEADGRYHVCRYTLEAGVFRVETLSHDVVDARIKDADSLRKALVENLANPCLFDAPDCYQRLEE